jgi:hypothetical protein
MAQEEEVLGKAYDSRLMKRLLGYLRPYKWQVVVALVSIVLKAGADLSSPRPPLINIFPRPPITVFLTVFSARFHSLALHS